MIGLVRPPRRSLRFAAPCCFPIFAAISAGLGLVAFGPYEQVVLYVLQGSALISLVGLFLAYLRHRHTLPLVIGVLSAVALAYSFYWSFNTIGLYVGLFGLFCASIVNFAISRNFRRNTPILQSTITCPNCGHGREETMPTNACLFFYDCTSCGARLKPKPGDCCVFCSYGSRQCPPMQTAGACCA